MLVERSDNCVLTDRVYPVVKLKMKTRFSQLLVLIEELVADKLARELSIAPSAAYETILQTRAYCRLKDAETGMWEEGVPSIYEEIKREIGTGKTV